MSVEKRLSEIWAADYIQTLPSLIKDRGFIFADNEQKDILITGFNPSFRDGEVAGYFHGPIRNIWFDEKHDNYWSPIKKMLVEPEQNIDLRENADYLDIFYFREQNQNFLQEHIIPNPNGVRFLIDQLNLTQNIIENIVRPKLLVVKNKESWVYFGKLFEEKGWIWMGYKFEFVQNMVCGELYKIVGLLDSPERIAPEITKTNLEGSYVFFTQHINQYTAAEKRPTASVLKAILDWYDTEKNVRKLGV